MCVERVHPRPAVSLPGVADLEKLVPWLDDLTPRSINRIFNLQLCVLPGTLARVHTFAGVKRGLPAVYLVNELALACGLLEVYNVHVTSVARVYFWLF